MYYRAMTDFTFHDQRGRAVDIKAGQLVDVLSRVDERDLLAKGTIGPTDVSPSSYAKGDSACKFSRKIRYGVFLKTSVHYSGGRVHLYQYALCLAQSGAEVFMLTDAEPRWAADYPTHANLRVLNIGRRGAAVPPNDLDVVVTDSKTDIGRTALSYHKAHPWTAFVCFNFETPNWVAKFVPDYASRLESHKDIFQQATYLLSNSGESAKHLLEWVERSIPYGVLQPAVNTYALDDVLADPKMALPPAGANGRPYALWSARAPAYKGLSDAVAAVRAVPEPFDLAVIGQGGDLPSDSEGHRWHVLAQVTDKVKYHWMRHASVVLAPSRFEGFGMVPAESLCCGVPVVAYDLPVLRQEYGDRIVYARWNERADFVEKVCGTVKGHPPVDAPAMRTVYGMDAMREKLNRLPHHGASRKRVSVQLLAYWGFVPQSVEAVYPYADEIIVAFGPTEHAALIDDGSLDRLRALPDPDHKIQLEVRPQWKDKLEMRNWCLSRMTGSYHILLDGDEIWTGLDAFLAGDAAFGCPRWFNFWHNGAHWIHDGDSAGRKRWGVPIDGWGSLCHHYRCSMLRRSYRFIQHPVLADINGNPLHVPLVDTARAFPDTVIYHLGHALPESVMLAKHEYYRKRDGDDAGRRQRQDAWHKWNGQPGPCGDGFVAHIDRELPALVKQALTEARIPCQ